MKTDLTGKTIVIRGGSSGVGVDAARILRQLSAWVLITWRSDEPNRLAENAGCDFT